jgi:hypothetical protein
VLPPKKVVTKKGDEEVKEEAKDSKKAPPKKEEKKKPGKGEPEKVEEEIKEPEDEIMATEGELEAIKHIYVNMLLQRTKNPQNAIVGLDVVLADENLGPELSDNHYAVAVPIRQHPGTYEK